MGSGGGGDAGLRSGGGGIKGENRGGILGGERAVHRVGRVDIVRYEGIRGTGMGKEVIIIALQGERGVGLLSTGIDGIKTQVLEMEE